MIFGFFKKLIKHYIDKFINWMRMVKFDLELETQIKKYHDSFEKKEKPKIIEKSKFGEDDWSISIGDVEDGNTKN
tara:strand:+ start:145 stop:369 length:225 start_codon:yes stop_codon:yes gene_type:complete